MFTKIHRPGGAKCLDVFGVQFELRSKSNIQDTVDGRNLAIAG